MTSIIILGIFGPWQIVIVLLVVLLLFGRKKNPELMKGIGEEISEFKKASEGFKEEEEEALLKLV